MLSSQMFRTRRLDLSSKTRVDPPSKRLITNNLHTPKNRRFATYSSYAPCALLEKTGGCATSSQNGTRFKRDEREGELNFAFFAPAGWQRRSRRTQRTRSR